MLGLTKRQWIIYGVFALAGGLGGYLYWHFFGCTSGCTIKASPWRMTFFGALLMVLAYSPEKNKSLEKE
jgi:hypothetical protein